jgi:hypothetical protein
MSGDDARLARTRNAVDWPREARGVDVLKGRTEPQELDSIATSLALQDVCPARSA